MVMNEETPLLAKAINGSGVTNGGNPTTTSYQQSANNNNNNHDSSFDMEDDLWSSVEQQQQQQPVPHVVIDLRPTQQLRPQHEKSVSLLLEDEVDHIFRIVEPGSDRLNTHVSNHHHHHHHEDDGLRIGSRERSESFMSEITEILAEVKETIAEAKVELIEVLHEDLTTPIKPREEGEHSQKLSAVALAVIVFYKVSGGPFGCEPSVKAAGPFFALLGFTILPFLVSIPEALVTAELGSAYPEPSGGTLCVNFFGLLFSST
jgi:hypothetical protein